MCLFLGFLSSARKIKFSGVSQNIVFKSNLCLGISTLAFAYHSQLWHKYLPRDLLRALSFNDLAFMLARERIPLDACSALDGSGDLRELLSGDIRASGLEEMDDTEDRGLSWDSGPGLALLCTSTPNSILVNWSIALCINNMRNLKRLAKRTVEHNLMGMANICSIPRPQLFKIFKIHRTDFSSTLALFEVII